DKNAYTKLFETLSLREVALKLDIGYDTARKYCHNYGIELPKSSYETAIVQFLRNNGITVETNNRMMIKPLELDIVLPDYKIAIEFCGIYWHSERNKSDPNYHYNKMTK